jgi:hypothetical protein
MRYTLENIEEVSTFQDIPAWFGRVTPPFDDVFLEFAVGPHSTISGVTTTYGCLVSHSRHDPEVRGVVADLMNVFVDGPEIHGEVAATLSVELSITINEKTILPAGEVILSLDDRGQIMGKPAVSVYEDDSLSQGQQNEISDRCLLVAMAALTAFKFLNCKGIPFAEISLPTQMNRERRKAGMKPFLRHHTIIIEPFSPTKRTGPHIDSDGVRRAMHRCRGHFATYSDSFMGRKLDEPMTLWRPAHVRGSAKQGVVVSDYNVKAPMATVLEDRS